MNNQSLNVLNNRILDENYFSIIFLSQNFNFKNENGFIYQRKVYFIIGCNLFGIRKYITSIFEDEYKKTSDWYNLFISLKSRGIKNIFYAVIPDNDNIKKALNLAFKDIKFAYNLFEIMYKINHYISTTKHSTTLVYIKQVLMSENLEDYIVKEEDFINRYNDYQFIKDILINEFENYKINIKYPVFLRKHIFAFYFSRELLKKILTISHIKEYFDNIDEIIEQLIPLIQIFEYKIYCPKTEWNKVINYLYADHKELLINYL